MPVTRCVTAHIAAATRERGSALLLVCPPCVHFVRMWKKTGGRGFGQAAVMHTASPLSVGSTSSGATICGLKMELGL